MLKRLLLMLIVPLVFVAQSAAAQLSNILVIDQEQVYAQSEFAKKMRDALSEDHSQIELENERIFQELRAEELEITEKRATYTAEEFEEVARLFDQKVVTTRQTRFDLLQQAGRDLAAVRGLFFERIEPVIAQIMIERKAAVILDQNLVVWKFDQVDITDLAIERIDQTFME